MLGAECVAITPGPAGGLDWNAAAAALSTALEPVLRQHHLPLAVEHAHSLRADLGFLHSLRDAIDFARQAGVTVCMECNACWAERDLLHTIETSVEYIGLVQVDDFVVGTRDTPNRVVPGDGDIDLRGIIHQLLEAGYQGSFDIEVVGPRIEAEGYPSAIRRSVRYLSDLLTDLGA